MVSPAFILGLDPEQAPRRLGCRLERPWTKRSRFESSVGCGRDRWFESAFLHQRVSNEPVLVRDAKPRPLRMRLSFPARPDEISCVPEKKREGAAAESVTGAAGERER